MSSCENPQTSFYLRAHYPVRVERRGRDSGQTNHITRPKLSVPEASQLEQLQRCRKKKTVSSLLPLQLVAFHCDSWLKVIHVLVLLSKTYCSLEQWFLTIGSWPNFGHQHHLEGRKKKPVEHKGLLRLSTEDTEISKTSSAFDHMVAVMASVSSYIQRRRLLFYASFSKKYV